MLVHHARGPVGDLHPRLVRAVPLDELRLVARAVDAQPCPDGRAVPARERRGLGAVRHARRLDRRRHARHPAGRVALPPQRRLQRRAVEPAVRLLEPLPRPVAALPVEEVGRGPHPVDALGQRHGGGRARVEGFDLVHPHPVVVGPRRVRLRVHDADRGPVLLGKQPRQHRARRPAPDHRHVHVHGRGRRDHRAGARADLRRARAAQRAAVGRRRERGCRGEAQRGHEGGRGQSGDHVGTLGAP